jgi:hypothetical protein
MKSIEGSLVELLAEKARCADRLRSAANWPCEAEVLEAAMTALASSGERSADAWLWFLEMCQKLPPEAQETVDHLLGDLHVAGERCFIASSPDLINRLRSTPLFQYDA